MDGGSPLRSLGCILTLGFIAILGPAVCESGFDYPPNSCADPEAIQESSGTCDSTGWKFSNFSNQEVQEDIGLIYSRNFRPEVTGYPYMTDDRINLFLRGLDLNTINEYHLNYRDYELAFNYFHGAGPSGYYGTFGLGNPRMRFFPLDSVPLTERDHVDIYLNHPSDPPSLNDYPAHQSNPDLKEDGSPTACDEYSSNAVQAGAGFRKVRDPSNA